MLAQPSRATTAMHVEHADQECAGFLWLYHIVCRKNARHVPDFEGFLDVRPRILEALVCGRQIVHDIGGKHRIHEADFGHWPRHHGVIMRAPAHRHISAAIGFAGDDRDLRHSCQTGRVHEVHDLTRRSTALGLKPDDKARRIHDANERNVEAIAKNGKIYAFAAGIRRQRAAANGGIAGYNPDRLSVEPGQSDNRRFSEARLDFEKTVAVEDHLDYLLHIVDLRTLLRQDIENSLLSLARSLCDLRDP